jgi:hypothetical protein
MTFVQPHLLVIALTLLGAGLGVLLLPAPAWRRVSGVRLRGHNTDVAMLLLFSGVATAGAALLGGSGGAWLESRSADGWNAVEGVVTRSAVVRAGQPRSSSPRFEPDVEYSYAVGGTEFTGTRVSFDPAPGMARTEAEALVLDRYRQGAAVTVYVDPASPGRSVLDRSGGGLALLFAALGGLLLGVGVHQARLALAPVRTRPGPGGASRMPGPGGTRRG